MSTPETIAVENAHMPPFFAKTPISIARGEGVWVWDEEGRRYLDLTAGWGVTSIGHAHPVIVRALAEQGARILQNPDSGLTYSPARASLLELLAGILPAGLTRVFFTNSGAEANDAAVKLARKATGRTDVIATDGSFHGRTISMVSATGQAKHRDKFRPLMPGYRFVPYGSAEAVEAALDDDGRRRDRRARPGRGRRARAPARLPARALAALPGERVAARRRRGPDRLLPHRPAVRVRGGRRGGRPPHHGQGHRRRVPAGRVRDDRRRGGPAGGRRPRRHVLRQPAGVRGGRGRDPPPHRHRRTRARGGAGRAGARAHDSRGASASRAPSPARAAPACCCSWSSPTSRPPPPWPPSACGAACSCGRPRAPASACSRR